jgi:hypothetical protein
MLKLWIGFCLVGTLLVGSPFDVAGQAAPPKAATPPKTAAPQPQKTTVTDLLGKATLDQIKRAYPGGKQDPISPHYNTLLAKVSARTRYVEPKGKTAYYFNSRGILVRVATTPKRLITKAELLRTMPDLKFTKEGPDGLPVAFMKRPDGIIQGFYLTKDGREVKLTTLDYVK